MDSPAFAWTAASELAADLIAGGSLSLEQVAGRAGVDRKTLFAWRKRPDFRARVDGIVADFREGVRARGLAVRERRIDALNDRWERLQRVVEERADDPVMKDVPGGRTGFLVRDVKSVGSGEGCVVVDVYRFDAALARELREVEKQAAIEMGQWAERTEHSGGLTIKVEYADGPTAPDVGGDPDDPR